MYKEGMEAEKSIAAELSAIQIKQGSVRNISEIEKRLKTEKESYNETTRKQTYIQGSKKSMEMEMEKKHNELRKYKDVESQFLKQEREVHKAKKVIGDISTYMEAVEKALVAFHNKKMANINKTIKELWQKTYRNSDIDYIKVKYQREGKTRKYRVVMISGGTELDNSRQMCRGIESYTQLCTALDENYRQL